MAIVIIKSDGEQTYPPMEQTQAENYLINLIKSKKHCNLNRVPDIKQALNDVTNPKKGKATGDYEFDGHRVLHASAGDYQHSVTLFYYRVETTEYIIAMGEHSDSYSYKISDYGQPDGDFRKGATIEL